jgi:hypothetical protein
MIGPNVIVVEDSIVRSRSGLITSVAYIDFETHQFPSVDWDDFVVVILSWWLPALVDLVGGNKSKAELRFMDAPLLVSIRSEPDGRFTFRCIEEPGRGRQFEADGSPTVLLRSLLSAALRIHEFCERNRWHSRDIQHLEAGIEAAQVVLTPSRIR